MPCLVTFGFLLYAACKRFGDIDSGLVCDAEKYPKDICYFFFDIIFFSLLKGLVAILARHNSCQFTLHASTKKGNRPSYIRAAKPEISIPLYEQFCKELSLALGKEIGTGEFGADMKVELLNDGPVTICMDTKNKE